MACAVAVAIAVAVLRLRTVVPVDAAGRRVDVARHAGLLGEPRRCATAPSKLMSSVMRGARSADGIVGDPREVHHDVHALEHRGAGVADVVLDDRETVTLLQRRQQLAAEEQPIEDPHAMAGVEQQLGDDRADVTRRRP